MITTTILFLALPSLMVFCIIALQQDARQRRIDRHMAVALAADHSLVGPSSVPLILRAPQHSVVMKWLNLALQCNAPRRWPPWITIGAGMAVALLTILLGRLLWPLWLMMMIGLIDGCLVMRGLFGWQQRSHANKLLRQLPDTIELVTSAVRAGLPISESFRIISNEMPEPTKGAFVQVLNEMSLGRRPDEALRSVYDRTHVQEYAIFSVTLAVQSKSGGRLAETLLILGDAIRQRVALAGRAKALAGEAALSAKVLASLPFLSMGIMYFERPDSLSILLHVQRGQKLFGAGVVALILGILTMRRMIRKGTSV